MRELWMPILGYEDCYSVSNKGRVKRTADFGSLSGGFLAQRVKRHGYVSFHLCRDGIRKDRAAHRLVWEAFNGPLPDGKQINHINGKKTDNRLANLEPVSRSGNMLHAYRVLKIAAPNNPNFGSKNGSAKLTEAEVAKILGLYLTGKYRQKDLAAQFGVSQRMISLITRREKWQHVTAATQFV